MEKIAEDFKDKGVISYFIYTWKPQAEDQSMNRRIKNKMTMTMIGTRVSKEKRNLDFSSTEETETHQESEDIALEIIKRYNKKRTLLIDTLCPDCIQRTLAGGEPGRITVIDREGKVALWQSTPDVKKLRAKLEEMTEK